jgi:hypothetical protein
VEITVHNIIYYTQIHNFLSFRWDSLIHNSKYGPNGSLKNNKRMVFFFSISLFVCVYVLLGFELKTLYMPDQQSATWAMLPTLSCFSYTFNGILSFCPDQPGLQSFYLCFLCNWDDKCSSPCPTFIAWDVLSLSFCWADFKLWSSHTLKFQNFPKWHY